MHVLGCLYLKVSRGVGDDGFVAASFEDISDKNTYMLQYLEGCYLSMVTMSSVGYGESCH